MASKKDLLKNLRDYSPEEIAEAVKTGTVTLYELGKESEGAFTPLLKRKVKEILDRPEPTPDKEVQAGEVNKSVPSPSVDSSEPSAPAVIETSTPDIIKIEQPDSISAEEPSTEYNSSTTMEDVIDNKGMFNKPFSFKGRIRRLEYGISFIIYFIWYMIVEVASKTPNLSQGAAIIILISIIPVIWFLWAQGCKRCHDRGNSGWYQIIPFYFLVLLFGDGEPGNNDYGTNPKE